MVPPLMQHAGSLQQHAALPCSFSRPRPSRSMALRTARSGARSRGSSRCRQHSFAAPMQRQQQRPSGACQASIDDPELLELVKKLDEMTPAPPAQRELLDKAVALIDAANAQDPQKVTDENGERIAYRLAYSKWVTEWVKKLYPKASDELLILARGRNIESWRLSEFKRDDYAPNLGGQRMWESDRKKWLAQRLTSVMKEAGYGEPSIKLVEDVMMAKGIPDPRDMRKHDLVGPFGLINYRLLESALMVQALADADALLFLDKNFAEMFNRMAANEVLDVLKRELSRLSARGVVAALRQKWTPVQEQLLKRALPVSFRYSSIMLDIEGVSAASTHPGDWRYKNFDYE